MANPIRAGHWPRCGEVICTGAPCGKGKISEQLKLKTVFHSEEKQRKKPLMDDLNSFMVDLGSDPEQPVPDVRCL